MSVAPPGGQDRIMIYDPKSDGTYITEFRIADGESLAISVPAGETRVLKHFQARMPYGLVVPDVPRGTFGASVSLQNGALVTYPFVSPTPEGSRDPARAGALTSHARAGFSLRDPAAFRKRPPHACGVVRNVCRDVSASRETAFELSAAPSPKPAIACTS